MTSDAQDRTLQVKVTKIGARWHARLMDGETLRDEMACEHRIDIGYICREMMRWQDKGGGDQFTHAARRRHNERTGGPLGRVWYQVHLEKRT